MNKPKNMTPEQEAAWNEKARAKSKAYYEANREKCIARAKSYRELNREKERARKKAHREANIEKERYRLMGYSQSLSRSYVARSLHISVYEATPELIEMKRNQLQLKRSIKKLKEHISSAT